MSLTTLGFGDALPEAAWREPPGDLLDKRLVVVMGKGGVGRSTVAAALGLIAARRGRRALLCEVSGQARLAKLGTDLATISIAPESAKLERLERQLRSCYRAWAGADRGPGHVPEGGACGTRPQPGAPHRRVPARPGEHRRVGRGPA